MPEYTLGQLAERVAGKVEGDPGIVVKGLAAVDRAVEGEVTFVANPRYASLLASSNASAAIVGADLDVDARMTLIRVKDPNAAFVEVAACFAPPPVEILPGVHERAVVAKDVVLGRNVSIGAGAVVARAARIGDDTVIAALVFVGEETSIGRGCFIHPNVTIRERVLIGDRCIVHSGTVIGSDGFGYVTEKGVHRKIPQIGTVVIEDDVEIGACVTVDRARFDRTLIGRGSKIDNLVQVAHNVRIGRHALIVSLVALAGSVRLGDNVTMGGQSAVSGHVEVGDNVVIAGRAGVTKDVPSNGVVSGFPAQPHARELRLEATLRRVPELLERIKALEKRLGELDPKADDDR